MEKNATTKLTHFQRIDEDKFRAEAPYKTLRPIFRVIALCYAKALRAVRMNDAMPDAEIINRALEEVHAECERILGHELMAEFWNDPKILDVLNFVNMCIQAQSTKEWMERTLKKNFSSKGNRKYRKVTATMLGVMLDNFYARIAQSIPNEEQKELKSRRNSYKRRLFHRRFSADGLTIREGMRLYCPQTGAIEIPIWTMAISTDYKAPNVDDKGNVTLE